ncbi:transcriptional adapter 3-B-like isoform X2 [Eriocheir sinensis]|uniref:transcriptional adapter 3-B-like isoform X2 n=1 Tax=Eriocheir sinensis TaxID=95602 RepID=UPI0021C9DD97|nr:transcriptional adapter 3-B-like isoform X2 [Eriocheir sinensis]
MMPPSPSKSKNIHKSSGKLFRHKEKERSGSGGSSGSGNNGNSTSSNSSSSSSSNTSSGSKRDDPLDLKDCPLSLPVVGSLDHTRSLPRYTSLVNAEGVSMEELDGLQLELELLLSSVLVRQMSLNSQLSLIHQLEKGKPVSPGKKVKREDCDRPSKKMKESNGKPRDVVTTPGPPPGVKPSKVKCSVQKYEPVFDVPDLGPPEQPKPPPPKNDITNRFWAYVEQYCQEITVDDIKMLEDLINAPNDDSDYYKTPPLGRHYTLRWAQEDLQDEQKEGMKLADGKKKGIKGESGNSDLSDKLLKEVDMNGCSDDVAPLGPLTQRLIAGLVEENVLVSDIENKGVDGLGHTRPGLIKSLGLGSASSLEKRIKKELQEQGVMETDYGNEDDDDEILMELKRCQTELRAVSNHNVSQLTRLLNLARDSLVRHDLKKRLRDADQKVLEAYRTIAAARQKKKTPSKKDKDIAWKAIKDREAIVRQLDLASNNNC